MLVEVRLFAAFRKNRFDKKQMELAELSSVADLLKELSIPEEQVGILLVNGDGITTEHKLSADDVVSIFPLIGGG